MSFSPNILSPIKKFKITINIRKTKKIRKYKNMN